MAKKARKKSARKSTKKKLKKRKFAAPARKKRKSVVKKAKGRARKKPAAKSKGIVGTVLGAAEAVVDTLTEAERLRHKLEPRVPSDLE